MKIVFLGTSAAVPTMKRNVSALALYFENSGKFWLFDCGEGTQQQLKKTFLKLSKLEKVFISHFHGDHLFGLPGMLSSRTLEGVTSRVDIYGPEGIKFYIDANQKITNFHLVYELGIHTLPVQPMSIIYEDDKIAVVSMLLKHSLDTYGFSVYRKPAYRFNVEKAIQHGIPEGPLFGALKSGRTIKLEDGKQYEGKDFIEKIDSGKKIVYCGDTAYCENSVILSKGADVLIHEATFSKNEDMLAKKSLHSTVEDACRVAKEAGVAQLILTHFSPRYDGNKDDENVYTVENLAEEAKSFFTQTLLAKDLMEYNVT